MKFQTIITNGEGRSWDSIKGDENRSLCRVLDFMRKDYDQSVAEHANGAMIYLDLKNDYEAALLLLRTEGFSVTVKTIE